MSPQLAARPTADRRAERVGGSRQRETLRFRHYRRYRDPSLREELVRSYLPLARSVARRFEGRRVPLEDLVQIAALGLIKALDRYDPARGTAFSSLAVPTMVGEVQRYFRDHTWAVRPPRELQEHALRVARAAAAMSGELGRAPWRQGARVTPHGAGGWPHSDLPRTEHDRSAIQLASRPLYILTTSRQQECPKSSPWMEQSHPNRAELGARSGAVATRLSASRCARAGARASHRADSARARGEVRRPAGLALARRAGGPTARPRVDRG
jgi:RNA polymerase sigma factor (sigma-70 family)